MKTCLNCNKEIILPETTNVYIKSNFKLKKFCSDVCRIESNNKLKKTTYVLKNTEHDIKPKEVNILIKGDINFSQNRKDGANPDIIKGDTYYEFELFRKSNLSNKIDRFD